jgi:hypothetical protein
MQDDWTALMWGSHEGKSETVRVLVEHGASVEAVDKVHIHAHALVYTCCFKNVSGIMRMTIIDEYVFVCNIYSYVFVYIFLYIYIGI